MWGFSDGSECCLAPGGNAVAVYTVGGRVVHWVQEKLVKRVAIFCFFLPKTPATSPEDSQ